MDYSGLKCKDYLKKAVELLIQRVKNELLAIGEPAESVQIGRLQVADDLRCILRETRSLIVDHKCTDTGQ